MKKEEALELIRNNWKAILIGLTIVLGAVLLAILALKLKKLWDPKYKMLEYTPSNCEKIAGTLGNDKEDEKLLFFNEGDLRQLITQVLNRIDNKIRKNKAGENSAEVHFLIDGEPGNGKTSLARGVSSYIAEKHKQKVFIMMPDTEWIKRKEGLIFKTSQAEAKLRRIFRAARAQAKARGAIIILNFEEVDCIFNNSEVADAILQELSPTDPINNSLIVLCTTNNKETVYNMRQNNENQGAEDVTDNPLVAKLLGKSAPEKNPQNVTDIEKERKIASIKRRLTEITISPPDEDTIRKILNHQIICQDKNRKEETINTIIPSILGCNTAYITGTVVPNINLDLQTKQKSVEEIVESIKEIASREKKQNKIELLKSGVQKSIFELYKGLVKLKLHDPFLTQDLQIAQINEQNGPFKNLETLQELHTSYNGVLEKLKKELKAVSKKFYQDKVNLSSLTGEPYSTYREIGGYGLKQMETELTNALRESHGQFSIDDAIETKDIKNLSDKVAELRQKISELEQEISDLQQENQHLSLKIDAIRRMTLLIERLIEAIEKEEAAKAAPSSRLYGVGCGEAARGIGEAALGGSPKLLVGF